MSQSRRMPETLDRLQRESFDYFLHEVNGLIADRTQAGSPAHIAAIGLDPGGDFLFRAKYAGRNKVME